MKRLDRPIRVRRYDDDLCGADVLRQEIESILARQVEVEQDQIETLARQQTQRIAQAVRDGEVFDVVGEDAPGQALKPPRGDNLVFEDQNIHNAIAGSVIRLRQRPFSLGPSENAAASPNTEASRPRT